MAASVRIDDAAFGDERYGDLAAAAGLTDADHARGKMARLWRQCTIEQSYFLSALTVVRVLGERGVEALVAARLGEVTERGIRIRGTKGRIEWLKKLRDNGKFGSKGGRPKRNPHGFSTEPLRVSKIAENETPLIPIPSLIPSPSPSEISEPHPPVHAHAIPPTAAPGAAPEPIFAESRQNADGRRRLIGLAWDLAGREFRRLKSTGLDFEAVDSWAGLPAADSPPMKNLRSILDRLLVGESPSFDHAWSIIERRIRVAASEAVHKHKHLRFMTPSRMWHPDSFELGQELTPEQVERAAQKPTVKANDPSVGRAEPKKPKDYQTGDQQL